MEIEFTLIENYDSFYGYVENRFGVDKVFPDGFPDIGTSNFTYVSINGNIIGYMGFEYGDDDRDYFHTSCEKFIPKDIRKGIFEYFIKQYDDRIILIKLKYKKGLKTLLKYYDLCDTVVKDDVMIVYVNKTIKGF